MQPYAKSKSERIAYARSKLEREYRKECGGFTLIGNYDPKQAMLSEKTICELCIYEKIDCEGTNKKVRD